MMRKRIFAAISAFLMICAPALCEETRDYFSEGNAFFKKGRYEKAIEAYNMAVESDPGYMEAHVALGLVYATKKDYDKAIEAYEKALEIGLNHTGYYNLGLVHLSRGDTDKAVEYLKKAIEIEPDYTEPRLALGSIFVMREDYDSAIKYYEESLEISPGHKAYHRLGLIYTGKEEYRKAVEYFQKAVQIDPEPAETYLWMGRAFYNIGDKTSAARQVIKLRELRRDDLAGGLVNWMKEKDAAPVERERRTRKKR